MARLKKITLSARIRAGDPQDLGRRLLRIIDARGGNKQRWLIGHLTRIAEEEESALGWRRTG